MFLKLQAQYICRKQAHTAADANEIITNRTERVLPQKSWTHKIMPLGCRLSDVDLDQLINFASRVINRPIQLEKRQLKLDRSKTAIVEGNEHEFYEYLQLNDDSTKCKSSDICTRVAAKNGHRQILCEDLIRVVGDIIRPPQCTVLILTDEDLFQEDDDMFVQGLSCFANKVGVISTFRLLDKTTAGDSAQKYWFDLDFSNGTASLEVLGNIIAHEQLHLLGFNHCDSYDCLMNAGFHGAEKLMSTVLLCPLDLLVLNNSNKQELICYLRKLYEELLKRNHSQTATVLRLLLSISG